MALRAQVFPQAKQSFLEMEWNVCHPIVKMAATYKGMFHGEKVKYILK